MGIEEDSLRELKALNQNIAALTRSMGKSTGSASFGQSTARDGRDDVDRKLRRGSKAHAEMEKNVASYNAMMKKWLKSTGQLTNNIVDASGDLRSNIEDANSDLDELRKSWNNSADAMLDMRERIDRWGTSQTALNSQTARVVAGMSRFSSNMAKTAKAQSLLYTEQLAVISGFKEFEKAAYFDELSKSISALSSTAKARLNLIDKSTGQLRADLDVADFQKVRKTLGEVEASMKELLSGTEFKSFTELFEKGKFVIGDHDSDEDATSAAIGRDKMSANREALTKLSAMLQAKGLYIPKNDAQSVLDAAGNLKNAAELNKVDWAGLAQSISMTEKSFSRAANNLDKNVDLFQDRWSRLLTSLKNPEGRAASIDSIKSMAASFLSSGAAFTKAKDKIVDAYKEISDFNIAQIPATYLQVNKSSIELGLSFKDTVKLMDENKRLLAIYGPEKFTAAFGTMSKTFQKYGYTMEQAAAMVGPTIESAIASGINIRDPGRLNQFTDTMMTQFQKVSGMVKISAEEFATLNKTLFQSEGSFETMLGLDMQRRQAYAQELVQLRTRYVTQGLELQQANDLVKAQQEQQRGRLKDRTSEAAKLLTSAQLAGLGSDAALEVYRLSSKGRRSSDEQARLAELSGRINQGLEAKINQGYGASGSNALGDIYNEARLDLQATGAQAQITKAGSQMQLSKEAGAQVSSAEQKAASKAAQGNESIAKLGNAVNTASSVINNAFLGSIAASSVALVAFGFQLTRVSALMGGPGGLLRSLGQIGKGFLGMGGGAAAAAGGGALTTVGGAGAAGAGAAGIGGIAGAAKGLAKGTGLALAAYAAANGVDYAAGKLGAGGKTLDQAQDDANWNRMTLWEKAQSGLGRSIEGVGSFVGLSNMANSAAADRIANETAYLNKNRPISGMPVAPNQPGVGVDKNAPAGGINTSAQDANILGVKDDDAISKLQEISQNMALVVALLQKMTDQQGGNKLPPLASASAPISQKMNSIPSAYQFTTGRASST